MVSNLDTRGNGLQNTVFIYKTCKGYITRVRTTTFIVDKNLKNIVGTDFSQNKKN